MRKAIVWYEMLLKDRLMRKATWIAAAVMLCFLAIVTEIHIPSSQNRIVGICSQKSGEKAAIVTDLYAQQGAFDYKEYTDATQLYEDVQTGKLECGFVLSDQLEKKLETGDPEKCVQYVVSPYSPKGEVATETFFASIIVSITAPIKCNTRIYNSSFCKLSHRVPMRQSRMPQPTNETRIWG